MQYLHYFDSIPTKIQKKNQKLGSTDRNRESQGKMTSLSVAVSLELNVSDFQSRLTIQSYRESFVLLNSVQRKQTILKKKQTCFLFFFTFCILHSAFCNLV